MSPSGGTSVARSGGKIGGCGAGGSSVGGGGGGSVGGGGGTSVGGTAVGGTDVGGTAVGGTDVGGTSVGFGGLVGLAVLVGGTAVGGTDVGGAMVGLGVFPPPVLPDDPPVLPPACGWIVGVGKTTPLLDVSTTGVGVCGMRVTTTGAAVGVGSCPGRKNGKPRP